MNVIAFNGSPRKNGATATLSTKRWKEPLLREHRRNSFS